MAVETQVHDLAAGPINLRARDRRRRLRRRSRTPATRRSTSGTWRSNRTVTDDGMKIEPGAILKISVDTVVEPVLGAWVWARSTGKVVTTRAATGLY